MVREAVQPPRVTSAWDVAVEIQLIPERLDDGDHPGSKALLLADRHGHRLADGLPGRGAERAEQLAMVHEVRPKEFRDGEDPLGVADVGNGYSAAQSGQRMRAKPRSKMPQSRYRATTPPQARKQRKWARGRGFSAGGWWRLGAEVISELAPDFSDLADVVRVLDVPRVSGGLVLRVVMDAGQHRALGFPFPSSTPRR